METIYIRTTALADAADSALYLHTSTRSTLETWRVCIVLGIVYRVGT